MNNCYNIIFHAYLHKGFQNIPQRIYENGDTIELVLGGNIERAKQFKSVDDNNPIYLISLVTAEYDKTLLCEYNYIGKVVRIKCKK